MAHENEDTKVSYHSEFTQSFFANEQTEFELSVAAMSHTGVVRKRNEDHFAVIRRQRSAEVLLSNLPSNEVGKVSNQAFCLMVADGIGGAEFGDFASQLAIEIPLKFSKLATSWLMRYKDFDAQEIRSRMAAYIEKIQDAFRHYAQEDPDKRKMGTTLTAAYLLPPHAFIIHIGDSRAYLYRDHSLKQITRDQTLAQTLIDMGADESEVANVGHVLMNSLGSNQETVEPDLIHLELRSGDQLLLCTDGLSDMVNDETIASTLARCDIQSASEELVGLALQAGGRDNVTLILGELLEQSTNNR